MIETSEHQERVILLGVELPDTENFEMSMEELASLAETAGAEVVSSYRQKREKYDSKSLIGSGKLAEIKAIVDADEIDTVIVNDRLTPRQNVNLEAELGVKVIDRMQLILDILPCVLVVTKVNCKFIWLNSNTCCHVLLDKVLCLADKQVELVVVDLVKVS